MRGGLCRVGGCCLLGHLVSEGLSSHILQTTGALLWGHWWHLPFAMGLGWESAGSGSEHSVPAKGPLLVLFARLFVPFPS